MRRMVAFLLAAVLCVMGFCACGSEPIVRPPQALGSADLQALKDLQAPYVGMVLKSLDGQFYPLIKAGAEAEADRLGVELIVVAADSENDAKGQAELVDIMADMALDVLLVAPCEESLLTDSLLRATENGKHVLAVDEPLSYSGSEGYIGVDDFAGGFREGAYAATVAAEPSAIILRGPGTSRNHSERTLGMRASLIRSGITQITYYVCNTSREEAYQQTKELLEQGETMGVICTTDDDMALGAQQAVEESGKSIPIVSFDGTPDVLQLVEDGEISGVMLQDAYEIGVRSVQDAVRVAEGETIGDDYVSMDLVVQKTAGARLDLLRQRLENNE
ncbi:MAG: sugar ABC transporter substrate-binding protein [Eubacteriales bacterium]|nr:sugar ABC transporter substrate-binding protein [Eubacteriales bacterium]